MELNDGGRIELHREGAQATKRQRRIAGQIVAGAVALLLLAGCTPAPAKSPSTTAASASALGLPIIDGSVTDEGTTGDSKGRRVIVKSDSSGLLERAAKKLESAGFKVFPASDDALGATSKKYFVSVSVAAGKVTYVFTPR
ncbi:hypothetical protein ACIRCZ_11855 [Leifsonia sp. NPDC102414]|uniref:hypothetical protein n=1 Tax=Leifsonia sp. NPDC102414 TaxID=3364124 RepID=UPI00382C3639